MYGEHVEGFQAVSTRRREQRLHLLGRPNFFFEGLWGLYGLGDVARNEAVHHGLLESLVERCVDVLHRAGPEAGVQLL